MITCTLGRIINNIDNVHGKRLAPSLVNEFLLIWNDHLVIFLVLEAFEDLLIGSSFEGYHAIIVDAWETKLVQRLGCLLVHMGLYRKISGQRSFA